MGPALRLHERLYKATDGRVGHKMLGVPTLLLFGSEDPFARIATAHRLAQEIPHARLEVLDGVGHFVFDEVPQRAATIVVDFLGDLR